MLICEELVLLLARPRGMTEGWDKRRAWGLSAGAVCDLMALERVALAADGRSPLVCVTSMTSTASGGLDSMLTRLAGKPRKLNKLVRDARFNPERELVRTMVLRGQLARDRPALLGLFPARYRVLDTGAEEAIRARLGEVVRSRRGDWRDFAPLSILCGLGVATKVLPEETAGLSERRLSTMVTELIGETSMDHALKTAVRHLSSAMPAVGGMAA